MGAHKVRDGRRHHAFQAPLEVNQRQAWAIISLSVLHFALLCVPFLPEDDPSARWPVLGAYLLVLLVGLPVFFRLSMGDPAHPNVLRKERGEELVDPADEGHGGDAEEPPQRLRCMQCDVPVDQSTKHCSLCKKCVEGFDHHCTWLNHCIGRPNYGQFMLLVTCCVLLTGFHLAVALVIAARHTDAAYAELIHSSVFGGSEAYLATMLVLLVFPLFGFLGTASLLGFHLYIIALGKTTYQWIVDRRREAVRKLREREAAEAAAERERRENDPAEIKRREEMAAFYKAERERDQAKRQARVKRRAALYSAGRATPSLSPRGPGSASASGDATPAGSRRQSRSASLSAVSLHDADEREAAIEMAAPVGSAAPRVDLPGMERGDGPDGPAAALEAAAAADEDREEKHAADGDDEVAIPVADEPLAGGGSAGDAKEEPVTVIVEDADAPAGDAVGAGEEEAAEKEAEEAEEEVEEAAEEVEEAAEEVEASTPAAAAAPAVAEEVEEAPEEQAEEPDAANEQPDAANEQPDAANEQPDAANEQPDANANQQPAGPEESAASVAQDSAEQEPDPAEAAEP